MTETIDWKTAYEEALRQRDALTADANRYRFLRDHTWVQAYWIDGSGGIDTKIRVKGCVDHLDKAVDMERIKEPRRNPNAGRMCPECKAVGGPDGVTVCGTCSSGFWETTQPEPAAKGEGQHD